MLFGKRYRVGNYTVIKYNRTLRKQEVSALRSQMGIPADVRKSLQRAQLPYIRVEAVSGLWAVEFCCNTAVYRLIDERLGEGGMQSEVIFAHLFNMWFMDTTVPGDEEYQEAKAEALKGFMERKKSAVSSDDDSGILDEMEAEENGTAAVIEMAGKLGEGGGDGR